MDNVIYATFPQFRSQQQIALEQMAAEIFSFALNGGQLPTYGFEDTAPCEMPPESA